LTTTIHNGAADSSWAAQADDLTHYPRLVGTESTTIAVVGGGIAGVSTALNLALLGHTPILLEADAIGSGATGASGGIVAPQLVRHGFEAVAAKLGDTHARQLFTLMAQSGHYVFDLARRYAPAAEAVQAGFLAPAMTQAALRRISGIAAEWAPFRDDVSILSAEAIAEIAGISGYVGALQDTSGGSINPLGYVRGLAHAAEEAGARLFCQSAVTRIERVGSAWVLHTAGGSVTAQHVLLCANGGNAALHPRLAGTALSMDVCEVTTAPLSPELRARVLPQRHALTDVEPDVFTIRYDRDGGLVTAYPGGAGDREKTTQRINARLTATIPGWKPLPLTHVWQGTAWLNTSLLPRLVRVDDGMIAVQACNGRGLAFNSVIGRELAAWLDRGADTPPPLPLEAPQPITGLFLAKFAPRLVMQAGLIGKRLMRLVGPRQKDRS
jgi:glycine/D-amino acid oxidase-like deaminating enzyme